MFTKLIKKMEAWQGQWESSVESVDQLNQPSKTGYQIRPSEPGQVA